MLLSNERARERNSNFEFQMKKTVSNQAAGAAR